MLVLDAYGGNGGIAAYNRDAARAMCEDPETSEVVAVARAASRPVEELPPKLDYDLSGSGGAAAYIRAVLRQLRKGRFDLIYCAHVNLTLVALLAARLTRVPWLLAIYGIEAWQQSPRRLVAFAARRADHLISISELTLKRFLCFAPYPPERRSLAPNAVHLDRFGMRPKNPSLIARWGLSGRKVILTLGRMHPSERYKGFDEVLDILPALARQLPEVAYVIAGDGADRPRLKAKAADLGIADRVVFTGYIDEAEKADLYRLADVYVMPSYGEGFGFVFLEAMACGTPVVASAIDGGREAVLDGELGRIVNPHDPTALREAILAAFTDERRIPPQLDDFAWPNFAKRVQAIVRRLAPAPRNAPA
jgi:phosphatidylinositol alpha-1,6-mannosyltransferase